MKGNRKCTGGREISPRCFHTMDRGRPKPAKFKVNKFDNFVMDTYTHTHARIFRSPELGPNSKWRKYPRKCIPKRRRKRFRWFSGHIYEILLRMMHYVWNDGGRTESKRENIKSTTGWPSKVIPTLVFAIVCARGMGKRHRKVVTYFHALRPLETSWCTLT